MLMFHMTHTAETAWGQTDHCTENVYRTLKTYHHVNIMFTQSGKHKHREKALNIDRKSVV